MTTPCRLVSLHLTKIWRLGVELETRLFLRNGKVMRAGLDQAHEVGASELYELLRESPATLSMDESLHRLTPSRRRSSAALHR